MSDTVLLFVNLIAMGIAILWATQYFKNLKKEQAKKDLLFNTKKESNSINTSK